MLHSKLKIYLISVVLEYLEYGVHLRKWMNPDETSVWGTYPKVWKIISCQRTAQWLVMPKFLIVFPCSYSKSTNASRCIKQLNPQASPHIFIIMYKNYNNRHRSIIKIMSKSFPGRHEIHVKRGSCPATLETKSGISVWNNSEENRGPVRSATQLGKIRKRMGWRERVSEKSTVGHHWQRHKSRHSHLDSNANPEPSN